MIRIQQLPNQIFPQNNSKRQFGFKVAAGLEAVSFLLVSKKNWAKDNRTTLGMVGYTVQTSKKNKAERLDSLDIHLNNRVREQSNENRQEKETCRCLISDRNFDGYQIGFSMSLCKGYPHVLQKFEPSMWFESWQC